MDKAIRSYHPMTSEQLVTSVFLSGAPPPLLSKYHGKMWNGLEECHEAFTLQHSWGSLYLENLNPLYGHQANPNTLPCSETSSLLFWLLKNCLLLWRETLCLSYKTTRCLSNCLLNIYIYCYGLVFISALVREVFLCNGQQPMQRLTIDQSVENKWLLNTQP